MPRITHPSMRRVKSPAEQPQAESNTYVVDDPTLEPAPSIIEMQPPKPIKKPETQSSSKDMLESLLFLGRVTKVVEIGDLKFEISTLTQKENTLLMKDMYSLSGTGSDLFTVRTLTLAYVIRSINGTRMEDIPLSGELGETQFETEYDKKLAIVEQMQRAVIEKLHDEYINLNEESESLLDGEEIKN